MAINQKELDRRDKLRIYAKRRGPKIASKILGRVNPINLSRLESLTDDACLVSSNHVSQGDYFLLPYQFMINDFPFLRAVAGTNLNHPIIKKLIWDFDKWGVIWHDRSKKGRGDMKEYGDSVKKALFDGDSVLVFPEGGRNRHPGKGLREFRAPFYKLVLQAQEEMDKPINLVTTAAFYERRMEDGYFEKIDKSKGIGYFGWDALAHVKWRHLTPLRRKGEIIVNFSEPVSLSEIQGNGSYKDRAKRVVAYTRETMSNLLREIKDFRSTSLDQQGQRMLRGLVTG